MDLDSFIRQQRAQGHSREAIRDYLLTQGHPAHEVDAALRRTYPPHVPLFILSGTFIVIISIIIAFYLWPAPPPVFDVLSATTDYRVAAGGVLNFTTTLINPENVKASVTLLHELVLGNTLVGQKRTSVTMAKTQELPQAFPMPTVKPGRYVLRTTAYFDDTRAETELNLTILAAGTTIKPIILPPAPVLEEVGVTIPVEERPEKKIVKPARLRKPAAPVMQAYTPGIDVRIAQIARSMNAQECAKLPLQNDRDSCYSQLANIVKDLSLCVNIHDMLLHDSCLFSTGATDCDLFSNELNKEACLALQG